ncbi:LuxR C-terminal-related transcriptional regulator [Hymenobacter terrenus]|uniref:LuxR C-terminal-related transcriptional regulator n=1 Tax=Hymenobacter terrenus TaxID=1629124 RepID=UPI00061911BE|nr:LuxR C-terminal-related transcriptional regulator [Hymenobacter terrenus]
MNNSRSSLDAKSLSQPFGTGIDAGVQLENCQHTAQIYATIEKCICVLSDLKTRQSYLYQGGLAEQLGLDENNTAIRSIWEDELLNRIHPQDLQRKYRLEFQLFQLLKSIDISQRFDYEAVSKLRIKDKEGSYVFVKHRILYLKGLEGDTIRFALCLYNILYNHPEFDVPQGVIVNTKSAEVIDYDNQQFDNKLSSREKEILQLIQYGRRSKEIASKLSVSINTVHRHRQNILQKLKVSSAIEACRVAENMGLL